MKTWLTWLSLLVLICLLGTASLPAAVAAEGEKFWLEFREVQNADNSLTIEGLALGSEGEEVTIILSTGDFVTVNNHKEYQEIILSETKAKVNAKGYFQLVTPPVDEAKLKNQDLSIVLRNKEGKESGNTRKFPIQVAAPNPDLYDNGKPDFYAKYRDNPQDDVVYDPAVLASEGSRLASKIAAGDHSSYAVDSSGTLWAWGKIPAGVAPNGDKYENITTWRQPKPINTVRNVVQVAANGGAAAALTAEGIIWKWDYNGLDRIARVTDAAAISVGNDGNGLILKKDGTVYTWTVTQANEKKAPHIAIAKVAGLQQIEKITLGYQNLYGNTYMALQRNGQVWAWGNMSIISSAKQASNVDRSKEPGISRYMYENVKTSKPELLEGIPAVRDFAFIEGFPVFITQGNEFWSYLDTDSTFIKKPGKVSEDAVNVFSDSPYIQKKNGQYYVWYSGRNNLTDEPVAMLQGMKMLASGISLTSGANHMLGVQADGTLMSWGANEGGQLGVSAAVPVPSQPTVIKQIEQPVFVSASKTHVLALNAKGNLYGWGSNANQKINGSDTEEILSPVLIPTEGKVKKAAAGADFSLYLTTTGELYGWGNLNGLGMKIKTADPVRITVIPEAVKDMDVLDTSVAVLTVSGKVYQLGGVVWSGVGADAYVHNHYRQIAGITDAVAISMGGTRGYAVKQDGSVVYWWNGIVEGETSAKPMTGLKKIVALSAARANGEYLLAIDSQGDLWAWGDNSARQLGQNITQQLPNPINITTIPTRITGNAVTAVGKKLEYRSISASSVGALVLTTSNEMLFMGYLASPLQKEGLYRNVTFAEAGEDNMYWITGEKLYVYGYNNKSGQIGNGTKAQFELPQRVVTSQGNSLNLK